MASAKTPLLDTEYDRAKVPPYSENDPPPAPGSLKALLFPPLLNNVENKGTQGVRARYGAELPPFISIVRYPGRPVISFGERSGDHNHQDFPKSIAIQMGGVLRYKWEAYCDTNGRRTAIQMGGVLTVFPFPQSVGAPKALRYKLEAYCNTNGRCIAILF